MGHNVLCLFLTVYIGDELAHSGIIAILVIFACGTLHSSIVSKAVPTERLINSTNSTPTVDSD